MKPTDIEAMSSAIPYKTCTFDANHGTQASWYQKLQDVPRGVVKTRVIYEAEVVTSFHICRPFLLYCSRVL